MTEISATDEAPARRDHQLRLGQAAGNVGEEGLDLGQDAGGDIGGGDGGDVLGAGLMGDAQIRARKASGKAAMAAGTTSDRMRAPWLPPMTTTLIG